MCNLPQRLMRGQQGWREGDKTTSGKKTDENSEEGEECEKMITAYVTSGVSDMS